MDIDLERLLRYDGWANAEALAWLRGAERPHRCWRLLAHILAVHALFAARVEGTAPPSVWPDPHGFDFDRALRDSAESWERILTAGRRPEEPVSYTNSRGERWTSRLADIVVHVTMHGAYHRGQIAVIAGSVGAEPPYTDYIHATRKGLI